MKNLFSTIVLLVAADGVLSQYLGDPGYLGYGGLGAYAAGGYPTSYSSRISGNALGHHVGNYDVRVTHPPAGSYGVYGGVPGGLYGQGYAGGLYGHGYAGGPYGHGYGAGIATSYSNYNLRSHGGYPIPAGYPY